MINWLRGIAFYASWILFTLVTGTICAPAMLTYRTSVMYCTFWSDVTFWLLRVICNIRIQVPTLTSPDIKVYAANHESTLDTIVLLRALNFPAFILKRELYIIPIFGWFLWRLKPIAIDRKSSRAMDVMLNIARTRIAEGRNIVIFPQGTRSAPSKGLPFKRGVALLSAKLSEKVQPVALATYHVWPKACISKYPGIARFSPCEPMPECDRDITAWLSQLEERVQTQASLLRGLP